MLRMVFILGGLALLALGVSQCGGAVKDPAKAWLSAQLIDHAWTRTKNGEPDARPWPWMDSAPVARLSVARLNKSLVVMRGTSGEVLAFAPGWSEGTAMPGAPGISLISAHRDKHFGFLNNLQKGDPITLETRQGETVNYIVTELRVVKEAEIKVEQVEGQSTLLLSTIFPFVNWQPGGEMRFVIVAQQVLSYKETTT